MNEKFPPKQKLFFVLTLFAMLFLSIGQSTAQTSTISLGWNISMGCEEYDVDRKGIFLEDIQEGDCIIVCRNSSVKYTLYGIDDAATTWTVTGGTKSGETDTQVTVLWTSITFTITTYS